MTGPSTQIASVDTFVSGAALYVRVTTESGIGGVGECTFFGWPQAAAEVVRSFTPHLVGCDALDVEHHWLRLYRALSFRGTAVAGALAAIDQALWDIKGRRFEAPVWQLLGGRVRPAVRAMRVLPTGSPEEIVTAAREAVAGGYSAVKVLLFQHEHHRMRQARRIQELVERMAAVREAVGWDIDIGVDLHRNMAPGDAVLFIQEISGLRPLFVEDPIPPDSVLSLGEVAAKVAAPLAAGERGTTIWEFREYAERAGVHYLRPDVGIAGGITHVRKICAIAEAHHQGVIPHAVPSGPIATAAHVQLGVSVPNWEVQEHVPQDGPQSTEIVDKVIQVEDGYLLAPEEPGLGIRLDEEALRRHPPAPVGLDCAPLREDGSVAIR